MPTRYFAPIAAALGIAILLVLTLAAIAVSYRINTKVVQDHLLATRDTTARLLDTWQHQYSRTLPFITENPALTNLVEQLLQEPLSTPNNVSPTIQAIDKLLIPQYTQLGYQDYAIFSRDHRWLASSVRKWIGITTPQPMLVDLIDATLARDKPTMGVLTTRLPGHSEHGTVVPGSLNIVLCAPISSTHAQTILCLRIDARDSFYSVLHAGRSGETGESYIVNREGRILSPSRFVATPTMPATVIGLPMAYPSLWARVPPPHGEPLILNSADARYPLTSIASRVIAERTTGFMKNYRDYRGIEVVGAAIWIDTLNIGLIIEQDFAEAYAPYHLARNVMSGLGLAAIALALALVLVFVQSRRNLAHSERLLNAILDNADAYIYLKDKQGKYLYVNHRVEALYGRARKDILGHTDAELTSSEYSRAFMQLDQEVLSSGVRRALDEDVPDAQGNVHRCWTVKMPILLPGQATALIGISSDVTELWKLQQELEARVEARTKDLQEARLAAEKAAAAKASFLANMSHEIRTPMNAIIGMSYLALQCDLNDRARNYLEKIQNAGQHLLGIINAILDYSKIDAGKFEIVAAPFSLQQLVDTAMTMVQPRAQAKALALKTDIAPDLPEVVVGDALRIGQILTNFLSNAVKFTDRGSVSLRVCIDPDSADSGDSMMIRFVVKDTGIGIESKTLAQLFQPFYQTDVSTTRRLEGTGLGLAISKRLAKLLGGWVSAQSEPGKGSTFILDIPLGIADADVEYTRNQLSGAAPASRAHTNLSGLKILLVEDNDINQEVASDILSAFGISVVIADNGVAALEKLRAQSFDLILLDIQMPVLDGYRTAQTIRGDSTLQQPPIIAMTANALQGDRERCLAAGMNDYIAKPIAPEQLLAAIQRWAPRLPTATPDNGNTTPAGLDCAALRSLGLDTERALTLLMSREALYARVLQRFVTERADIPEQLKAALANKHYDDAILIVHSLKSLAATIGASELQQLCAALEERLYPPHDVTELIEVFEREHRRLIAGLKPLLTAASTHEN